MSSLFRNRAVSRAIWVAVSMAMPIAAVAADVQNAWLANFSLEYNTNREMLVTGESGSEGYVAELGTLMKIATPRSSTTFKPVVAYVNYPDMDEQTVNATVDLNSQLRGLRYNAALFGRFESLDTFSSELAPAEFNPVNPDLPTTPETGRVSVDRKRTLLTLVPSYDYALSERLDFLLNGVAQIVDYSGDSTGFEYIPYSHFNVETGLAWELNPKADVSFSVYGFRTSNSDDDGEAEGYGASVGYDYEWSERMSSSFKVLAQRDDITTEIPVPSKERSTNWGATFGVRYQGQVSRVNLEVGRSFSPSGFGGTSRADQVQVELRRSLSERTEFSTAVRYIDYSSLATVAAGDYSYLRAGMNLRWRVSPTWYVAGGVGYWREEYDGSLGGAANNTQVSFSFGYEGLQR